MIREERLLKVLLAPHVSEKGARAVITLLADLTGDGVAGDRALEGNEEGMQTFDQVIRIDDYRKKLEANISSFKGENLKLNQSNRILIVFNSLVAVLLLVTLFYFLRRMGKRKPSGSSATAQELAAGGSGPIVFTSFEDKLQHLERLGMLKEKGLLSEEEFLIEKQRVLGK